MLKISTQSVSDIESSIRPIIHKFIDVIESNFPKECRDNFYHNISNLKLVRKEHLYNVSGIYDSEENEITYEDDNNYTLFHELFHMASSTRKNVGFHSDYTKSGYGINEGYTELLTRKYFGKDEEDTSYSVELSVASILENVIGEDKMKKLYMTANYYGLVFQLQEYIGDDSIKFIKLVDQYTKLTTTPIPILFKISFYEKLIKNVVDKISQYLALIYINKNQHQDDYKQLYLEYNRLLVEYQSRDLLQYKYSINPTYIYKDINSNINYK